MENGKEFSIRFYTANKSTGKGGQRIEVEKAVLHKKKKDTNPNDAQSVETTTHKRRNPQHYRNATRNIKIVSSGQIRKVHIWLITEFNGKKVI